MLPRSFLKCSAINKQCVRSLMLHEHHGVRLLQQAGINVPPFGVGKTAEEAFDQAKKIGKTILLNQYSIV